MRKKPPKKAGRAKKARPASIISTAGPDSQAAGAASNDDDSEATDGQRIVSFNIYRIRPSPDNTKLYHTVSEADPATIELADSIRERGILEPLVISKDEYIIAGHRRHCAARLAGKLEVPCRKINVERGHGEEASDDFLRLLREHNRQRVKSRDEYFREAIIDIDPDTAHKKLAAVRRRASKIKVEPMVLREGRPRYAFSSAKWEFLEAVKALIETLKEIWPLSVRKIFYGLLNDPPLTNSKTRRRFGNNKASERALYDLLTRARNEGLINDDVIDDPTRPVTVWKVWPNLAAYYAEQMKHFLDSFWRDLLQSQPNHIEIVAEKNTLQSILSPVAAEFTIPITFGRGQCSRPPLSKIAKRFKATGKTKLIILALSDHDPDGEAIPHSIGQRLRDDFGIKEVEVIRVALTREQVDSLNLPQNFERAKKKSPNYKRYIATYHSDSVWELEAVPYTELRTLLKTAIESVIDRKAFNAEVAQEKADAQHNEAKRKIALRILGEQINP